MKVYLIRHAKTDANKEGRFVGKIDVPVSETGRETAQALKPFENIKRIYVSPMKRTMETAEILFPGSELIPRKEFAEMDFGIFEGKKFEDMANEPAYERWMDKVGLEACPGGEEPDDFSNRTGEGLMDVIREAMEDGSEHVYVVTHGGVIMSLMYRLTKSQDSLYDFMPDNCGGYTFEIDPKNFHNTWEIKNYRGFSDTDMIDK